MKRIVEDWTIERLEKQRNFIAFPEYQREKSLWAEEKKCLLIDSILRDLDIPKLYFNQLPDKTYEVIDGQQRLWAVWEFIDNEYKCEIDGKSVHFEDLRPAQSKLIRSYKLQITVFQGAEDEYLRLLFVRLQLGLLLNTGEKLHAATGKMKSLVFGTLSKHAFIRHLGIAARRYAKETLAAQIAVNSFTRKKLGIFARTRYDDLSNFFLEYADPKGVDKDFFAERAQAIGAILDKLDSCFGREAGKLTNRSYILSIYLFVEDRGLSQSESKQFKDFVFKLWARLKAEAKLGIDRKNRELYSFQSSLSSAPGEEYQIQRRHEKLVEYFKYYLDRGKIKGD